MYAWLNGPGAVFRKPRKNSTNYLGAYDKSGNLIRGRQQRRSTPGRGARDGEDGEQEDKAGSQEDAVGATAGGDAPETLEDLKPFPLNPFFRSEPVLSVELRNEIYTRVVKERQTVREVSIALHVEMSRVGAVVRLKTIEQDWIREVS